MPVFESEGFEIAYEIYGEGPPVVAVHGFASNGQINWVSTGWVETLNGAGYQVIAIDNRGHGKSDKIYDASVYGAEDMARDVANLIDHLGHGKVALIGYSMGARISAFVCLQNPDKVACAIFGGLGGNMIRPMLDSDEIIAALNAPSLSQVKHPTGRQFRIFAEHTKSDLKALSACMAGSRTRVAEDDVRKISVPVLVAVGSEDETGGDPNALADLMEKGEALVIERRDHMRATGDPQFKRGAVDFLSRVYPVG
ncbi:alpha/beta fold hydrolase [Pelagibacterium xiamenense]|uniref:alpha/beta fold hydrolase n=1 Tax=Pelagibacterium xiamenense TaxID=2901140 RepID=UPI001E29626E|nr:alpha/beta hydrolase [Pelagibacterium xiamenense]MCD7059928.1 alpha/beta hydrolase [Pelagibacterium xiamenense]